MMLGEGINILSNFKEDSFLPVILYLAQLCSDGTIFSGNSVQNYELKNFIKTNSTRNQKRRIFHQEGNENVSESMVPPILVENEIPVDQDVLIAGPSSSKSPRT